MYKVIDKNSFYDMQDETKHVYKLNDEFPHDNRKISESRLIELSTDLNRKKYPLIELDSELKKMSKKDIQSMLEKDNIEYDKNSNKDSLIVVYEYDQSRNRLIQELEELSLPFDESLSNYEIVESILKSKEEVK